MSKVVVGISGGVDSSVAAAILLEQGYEVIGITFKFTKDFDTKDAIEVCKKLNIEHHIIDYQKEFQEKIINNFINDYKSGLTPNPCVICNKEIKINFLYQAMLKYKCDYIATGHYAKIINNKLFKSKDLNKDQTYFLSLIPKEFLSKIIFPLEEITKEEVRELANKYSLITATKKDSYDVCFITDSFQKYIEKAIKPNPGKIINIETNEIIGTHNGLNNYTIGQRKGLNIGGTKERMFVVDKDITNNILYIAIGNNNDNLYSTSCLITNVNLLDINNLNNLTAKFRYRQNEINVNINIINKNNIIVFYPEKVKSVTKGQVCSLYKNNECIGGGIIKEIYK